jgi:Cd2+/Zn2+-exporting ATPase
MLNHKGITYAHVKSDSEQVQLCIHYDKTLISLDKVQQIARRTGATITNRFRHVQLSIEGMDCSDCALTIEHSVSRIDGVLSASVSYTAQIIFVEYDSHKTSQRAIERRIKQLGYSIPSSKLGTWYQENRALLFSLVAGTLLVVGWLSENIFDYPTSITLGLYIAAYVLAGHDIARHAVAALRYGHFDTDLLMIIAALGAAALGQLAEGALLLFLFSLGHSLENKALDHTRKAIHALADFAPKTAMVCRNNSEFEVAVDQVLMDDIVIIRPGIRIPVDGEIKTGASSIDQSPVTGESIPVDKSPGDEVFAGSLNGDGALEVKVTRLAKDSTLARVIELVERAQTQKSPTQLATEKFLRVFVPAVLILSLTLVIVPPLFGVPLSESIVRALTILVAASPCALALGTPAAVLSGIAQAARNGVLIKGGVHLENLGRMQALALDKTGTITIGKPRVTDIITLDSHSKEEILSLAGAVESRSAHPLALAVVQAAQEHDIQLPHPREVSAVPGVGIEATVFGRSIWVRNPKGDRKNYGFSRNVLSQVKTLEQEGKTVILVGADHAPIGIIAIADQIRPGIRKILAELRMLGLQHLVMLTGDNQYVADSIARQVGLEDIRANLLPEDKLTAIENLIDDHEIVGMLGDGVNDAPALAQATIGVAMGGAGTDIALETADVALMADDLSKLPFTVGLGRATRSIIYQNLAIALGVIGILVILTVSGNTNIGGAIVFHEGSTLLVVLNALRLLRYPT